MPRGDKSKYTNKQQRQAEHIEEGYRERGLPEDEAERRAWATVNKMDGGGKKPGGSGRGKTTNKSPARRGGKRGGEATARRPKTERSASAKKAAATRARNAAKSGRKSAAKKSTRKSTTKSTRKSAAKTTRKSAAKSTRKTASRRNQSRSRS